MASEFDLLGARYLFRKGEPIYSMLTTEYGGPLLDKIREIERKKNADFAELVLADLADGELKFELRQSTDLDAAKARSMKKAEDDRLGRGVKYRCGNCNDNFYDLNDPVAKCTKCGKPKIECKRLG